MNISDDEGMKSFPSFLDGPPWTYYHFCRCLMTTQGRSLSQRERNLLPIKRTSSFSWGASGDRQSDSCWQSAKKERERLGWRWEIGHPARDLTDKEETRERIFFLSLSFKSATALWRWWIPCRQLASLRGTLSRRESEEIAFFLFGEEKMTEMKSKVKQCRGCIWRGL